jgi:hypothetical protein
MAFRTGLPPNRTRERGTPPRTSKPRTEVESPRLCLIGVKVNVELRREIDAYAEAQGITRSKAASEYLEIGRETLRERDGIPVGRADELLEAFEGLRTMLDSLGPPTLGILRLLAHWAARSGTLKVSEDELLAEVRTVSADEWLQVMADAEGENQTERDKLVTAISGEWGQALQRGPLTADTDDK